MMDRDAIIPAVISSVIVSILSSILFFLIGCACGWVGHKYKTNRSDKSTPSQAAPVYEDLQPPMSCMPEDPQEKATFELRENTAYGPIRST
jgi:hypothetical protein